ncbi:MAG TPA: hypothetical protein VEI24_01870 [Nitrospiria bacterium]|nr:hypothetical protein [Nitrospiria bacterium]HXZ24942.1 hypothetical protein [Nitrospiria bacterium]
MAQQTEQKPSPPAATRTARQVFAIAQRNGKSYWIRIGAAFINQDGSETVLLDALPVTGRIQIRSAAENGKPDSAQT